MDVESTVEQAPGPVVDEDRPCGVVRDDKDAGASKVTNEPAKAWPEVEGESDGVLAKRVAQGDQDAATILIERYQANVRSFLRKLCNNAELADDLSQDTFVRMLKHADRFDPKYPMRRWLLTIARRLLINYLRRADQRVHKTEYLGMQSKEQTPDEITAHEDQQSFNKSLLEKALLKLSESQRNVIVLFHQKEMSIQDVSEVLNMPTGTVKSHLHRARASLRKILEPQLEVIQP